MVGVIFDFPLLRAEKRDKRWLIPLAVTGVAGVWGLLSLDLVFDLVLELVLSCCGVGFLIGLMGGSNLLIKARFFLPKPTYACLTSLNGVGLS